MLAPHLINACTGSCWISFALAGGLFARPCCGSEWEVERFCSEDRHHTYAQRTTSSSCWKKAACQSRRKTSTMSPD